MVSDPSSAVTLDLHSFPLALIACRPVAPSIEAATSLTTAYSQILARRQTFAVLLDIRAMNGVPDARARKVVSDFMAAHREAFGEYCVADATLVGSRIVAGVVRAVNWMSGAKHPEQTFFSEESARAWCEAELNAAAQRRQRISAG